MNSTCAIAFSSVVWAFVWVLWFVADSKAEWWNLLRAIVIPMFFRFLERIFSWSTEQISEISVSSQVSVGLNTSHEVLTSDISTLLLTDSCVVLIGRHVNYISVSGQVASFLIWSHDSFKLEFLLLRKCVWFNRSLGGTSGFVLGIWVSELLKWTRHTAFAPSAAILGLYCIGLDQCSNQ